MNDYDMNPDAELLKAKFKAAGKTILPSSLTSQALFARMDAGEWHLPEGTAPIGTPAKVLRGPWRRWGTLAAAVLVVISLYVAGRSGLLGSDGLATAKTSESTAPEAAEQEMQNGNFFYAEAPNEESMDSALPEESSEITAAGSADEKGASLSLILTDAETDAAKAILVRQSWEPRGGTEAAAYLFTIEGSEYGFDPEASLLVDYTGGQMAFLSKDDCEALASLCP